MRSEGPLKVVVAEDEPLARERLLRLLREAGCEVVASLPDGPGLIDWLQRKETVDALFLDIHMPGGTAFETLAELEPGQGVPPLVFVSAFPEHALRAFEVKALDYLLKPVSPERLAQTLERLREGETSRPRASAPRNPKDRFPAKAGEGHVILDLRRVTHFEVSQEIVSAWVKGTAYRTSWRSLAEVEAAFPEADFLRIQRHVLLRPEAVLALKPLFGGRTSARVGEGLDLEVSRKATPQLKVRLGLS